ncbi:hypothetical protein LEL_08406 [Akanthomyces lecanii RCEF 1005]|uniref:Uncharacterized protein n=1 Tax=Akanthomyces lecanii RCEF 1005 TaxID=1081108 RepID=A0A162JR88_CORDF|nr:hypothetical protein LEL_08406 [Akanthomyces lecanii RCEF 1005]
MPVREHIQIQTKAFAPGVLPLSARTFRIVSCLRVVTGRGVPLWFFCRITAAFYNDRGQPVWSRRVLLYKIVPRSHHRRTPGPRQESTETVGYTGEEQPQRFPLFNLDHTQDDDAASSTSAESQGIITYTQEEYHHRLLHRRQDHTPVAQYHHQHRPVPYQSHQPALPPYQANFQHQIHPYHRPIPHHQPYLIQGRTIFPPSTFGPNQHPLQISCPPSSPGHWYTSFSPQERRWVNTWQPH